MFHPAARTGPFSDIYPENTPAPLRQAVTEFISARSFALSPSTIRDYRTTLERLCKFIPDQTLTGQITARQISAFLATIPGGKKNHLNHWVGLCAFWTWALSQGYTSDHAPRRIIPPNPKAPLIVPFTREEVAMLVSSAAASRYPLRDTAILKTMFDTGLRASEICGIRLRHISGQLVKVTGKGEKERQVPLCPSTVSSIQTYVAGRKSLSQGSYLFVNQEGKQLTRSGLLLLYIRLGERSRVNDSHPHKARHTFAINYLRNGGDPYTLQMILGHSTMEMVKRYLLIVQSDIEAAHARASPIANWGL